MTSWSLRRKPGKVRKFGRDWKSQMEVMEDKKFPKNSGNSRPIAIQSGDI